MRFFFVLMSRLMWIKTCKWKWFVKIELKIVKFFRSHPAENYRAINARLIARLIVRNIAREIVSVYRTHNRAKNRDKKFFPHTRVKIPHSRPAQRWEWDIFGLGVRKNSIRSTGDETKFSNYINEISNYFEFKILSLSIVCICMPICVQMCACMCVCVGECMRACVCVCVLCGCVCKTGEEKIIF